MMKPLPGKMSGQRPEVRGQTTHHGVTEETEKPVDPLSEQLLIRYPLGSMHTVWPATLEFNTTLPIDEARALRKLRMSVEATGARFSNGFRVHGTAELVRWLGLQFLYDEQKTFPKEDGPSISAVLPLGVDNPDLAPVTHVRAQLNGEEARGWLRIRSALDAATARLKPLGRPVSGNHDALRWICQTINEQGFKPLLNNAER